MTSPETPRQGRDSHTGSGERPASRNGPSERPASRTGGRVVAAAVSALQAAALLGFCIFYAVGLARGESDSPARAVMSIVLIAVFAVGLAALAAAWWRGAAWPSTPTVVWNALLLPVAWGLFQGGQALVGAAVLAVSLAGILAALASGTRLNAP